MLLALLRAIRDRRPERLRPPGAHGRALHAEPALPDGLLPARRRGDLDALPRLLRSRPAGRPALAGRARRSRSAPCCSGSASRRFRCCRSSQYIPYSPRGAGGPSTRLGVRDGVLDAARGALDDGAAAVQRRARRTTGARNFFKLAHRVSRGGRRGARGPRRRRPPPAAAGAGARRHRDPVPARLVRRPHAVLSPVVRSDADDEEGAGARAWRSSSSRCRCAAFAGFGADRLLRGEVSAARAGRSRSACSAAWRCSASSGVLQSVATVLAGAGAGARAWPRTPARSRAGRSDCCCGRARGRRRPSGRCGAAGSGARWPRRRSASSWSGDLWSIDRLFFEFRGPAVASSTATTQSPRGFAPTPKPFRVLDVGVYQGSYLMAHDIQTDARLSRPGNPLLRRAARREGPVANTPAARTCIDLLASGIILLPEAQAVPGLPPGARPGDHHAGLAGDPARARHAAALRPRHAGCGQAARGPDSAHRDRPALSARRGRPLSATPPASRPAPIRAGRRRRRARSRPTLAEWAPGRMRVDAERAGPTAQLPPGLARTGIRTGTPRSTESRRRCCGPTTRCSAWRCRRAPARSRLQFASAAYARGKLVTLAGAARDAGAAGGRHGGPAEDCGRG